MNNNKYALPPKLWLDSVTKELGLSDLTHRTQIETLIENVNTHGLRLKMGVSAFSGVRLQSKEQGIDHRIDHHSGVYTACSVEPTQWATDICTELTLCHITRCDAATILAWEVEVDGVRMYLVDGTAQFIISHGFDLENSYMDRDDLMNFRPKTTPAYADPKSKYYAPELMLALRLHEDLRIKNSVPHFSNLDDRVFHMMQQFYRAHGKISSASGRLATVIGDGKKLAYSIPLK